MNRIEATGAGKSSPEPWVKNKKPGPVCKAGPARKLELGRPLGNFEAGVPHLTFPRNIIYLSSLVARHKKNRRSDTAGPAII